MTTDPFIYAAFALGVATTCVVVAIVYRRVRWLWPAMAMTWAMIALVLWGRLQKFETVPQEQGDSFPRQKTQQPKERPVEPLRFVLA